MLLISYLISLLLLFSETRAVEKFYTTGFDKRQYNVGSQSVYDLSTSLESNITLWTSTPLDNKIYFMSSTQQTPSDSRLFVKDQTSLYATINEVFVFNELSTMIYTDVENQKIFVSNLIGQEFRQLRLNFRPDYFYANPKQSTLFGVEKKHLLNDVWVSFDLGASWQELAKDVKTLPTWLDTKPSLIYCIENDKYLVEIDIEQYKSNQLAAKRNVYVGDNKLDSFQLFDKLVFLTTVKKDKSLEIVVLNDKLQPQRVDFKNEQPNTKIIRFRILEANRNEVVMAVIYNLDQEIKCDLYESKSREAIFDLQLALQNVACHSSNDMQIEVKMLNEQGGLYVANAYDHENQKKTFAKTSYTSGWAPIELDDSWLVQFDLDSQLLFKHQYLQSSFEDPKLPEYMMATVVESSTSSRYLITLKVFDGTQSLNKLPGYYHYSFNPVNQFAVAIDRSQPTHKLLYSSDFGLKWLSVDLDSLYRVNQLIQLKSGRFLLFVSDQNSGKDKILQIETTVNKNQHQVRIVQVLAYNIILAEPIDQLTSPKSSGASMTSIEYYQLVVILAASVASVILLSFIIAFLIVRLCRKRNSYAITSHHKINPIYSPRIVHEDKQKLVDNEEHPDLV